MSAGSVSGTPGIWKCTCGLGIMSRSRSIPFPGLTERAPGRRNWCNVSCVPRWPRLRVKSQSDGTRAAHLWFWGIHVKCANVCEWHPHPLPHHHHHHHHHHWPSPSSSPPNHHIHIVIIVLVIEITTSECIDIDIIVYYPTLDSPELTTLQHLPATQRAGFAGFAAAALPQNCASLYREKKAGPSLTQHKSSDSMLKLVALGHCGNMRLSSTCTIQLVLNATKEPRSRRLPLASKIGLQAPFAEVTGFYLKIRGKEWTLFSNLFSQVYQMELLPACLTSTVQTFKLTSLSKSWSLPAFNWTKLINIFVPNEKRIKKSQVTTTSTIQQLW